MASSQILRTLSLIGLTTALLCAPDIASANEVSDQINVASTDWRSTCDAEPLASRLQKHSFNAVKRITIHYTDTPKTYRRTLSEKLCILYKFATTKVEGPKKALWGDIPYHYFISSDGLAGEARNPLYQVDSNTTYQRDGHIAIVVEGSQNDGITGAQKKKLFGLIAALQRKYSIPSSRIATHKDFAQTDCPGPSVLAAVREYKQVGNKNCNGIVCIGKPRCSSSEKLVNKARPGACCAVWSCEPKKGEEENPEENIRSSSRARMTRQPQPAPQWDPFHFH